jgi:hypothetical protein
LPLDGGLDLIFELAAVAPVVEFFILNNYN